MKREGMKRFNYLTSEIGGIYHLYAIKQGMSDSALDILYTICEQGDGCNQSDIYKLVGSSRQTINTAIHKLQKENFIILKVGIGKNTTVFLTEKGKEVVERKIQPLFQIENEIIEEWEDGEWNELLRLTEKYLDNIKDKVLAVRYLTTKED